MMTKPLYDDYDDADDNTTGQHGDDDDNDAEMQKAISIQSPK